RRASGNDNLIFAAPRARMRSMLRIAISLACGLSCLFAGRVDADLLEYVQRPDPATRWEKRSDRETGGVRGVEIDLVSQTWQGSPWRHRLRITIPSQPASSDLALLVVTGGANSW